MGINKIPMKSFLKICHSKSTVDIAIHVIKLTEKLGHNPD